MFVRALLRLLPCTLGRRAEAYEPTSVLVRVIYVVGLRGSLMRAGQCSVAAGLHGDAY